MHGITITKAPSDWEILQQENGAASVSLEGTYQVHPAAIEVGVEAVRPMARVMREGDNVCILPWTELDHRTNEDFSGTFSHTLTVPAGGPYRLETTLETKSTLPDLTWLYRGDCVLHLGVGDVFIIAGQSNSAGYGRDYIEDPPSLGIHLFRNRSRWDLATHPMNESTFAGSLPNEEMGIPGVSPYLSFGRNFRRYSGCPVGFIQTALGGSPLSRWLPETGDLYQNLMDKIDITHGKYAGILWYQGCSDTDPESAPLYYDRFVSMVSAIREKLGYEIPFFTYQLNRQIGGINDDCWGMVREAQRRAALDLPAVYVLPTTNCPLSDGIHNTAAANVLLGERMASLCGHVLCNGPAFAAPQLQSLSMEDDTNVCLSFSNMERGFLLFSGDGKDSGFTFCDGKGEITVEAARTNRQSGCRLYLKLSRKPEEDAVISFCADANPTMIPPIDEVTFLPPLAFYRLPVKELLEA